MTCKNSKNVSVTCFSSKRAFRDMNASSSSTAGRTHDLPRGSRRRYPLRHRTRTVPSASLCHHSLSLCFSARPASRALSIRQSSQSQSFQNKRNMKIPAREGYFRAGRSRQKWRHRSSLRTFFMLTLIAYRNARSHTRRTSPTTSKHTESRLRIKTRKPKRAGKTQDSEA